MLDKFESGTTKGLSENLTGGGSFRRDIAEAAAHTETRPVVAHVALYLCMVIALAMTMLFAMPNGVLADEAGATEGAESVATEPVGNGTESTEESTATEETGEPVEEGSATEGTDGTPGEQADESTNESEQPVVEEGAEGDSATVPLALDAIGDSDVNPLAEAGQWTSDPDTHDELV